MQFGLRSIEPEVSTKSITWGRMFRMSGAWADAVPLGEREEISKEATKMGSRNLIVSP